MGGREIEAEIRDTYERLEEITGALQDFPPPERRGALLSLDDNI